MFKVRMTPEEMQDILVKVEEEEVRASRVFYEQGKEIQRLRNQVGFWSAMTVILMLSGILMAFLGCKTQPCPVPSHCLEVTLKENTEDKPIYLEWKCKHCAYRMKRTAGEWREVE